MVSFKKSLTTLNEVRLEVPVPDFVPYACHYDANTILTKNGELLQIIKITGFSHEAAGAERVELRDIIRQAVIESVDSSEFSIWFHTVRRKASLAPSGTYTETFANDVNATWNEIHDWEGQYVNELYISILHDSQPFKIRSFRDFTLTLSYHFFKKKHDKYLDRIWPKLNEVSERMLLKLKKFGAKRLTVIATKDNVYSEPLTFFAKIMHLVEEKMPMPVMDISHYLATHRIAFGNNTLEIEGNDTKRFGAIVTLKEYHDLSSEAMDTFLQLPQQFIITQCLDFAGKKKALKNYEHQKHIIDVSGDTMLGEMTGINQIYAQNRGLSAYARQQISILFLEDNLIGLEEEVEQAIDTLNKLGIITVREDVRMEECFWSQLPANFPFIARQSYINIAQVAGFASLQNFPAGRATGNIWGPAVTVFRTVNKTPYFFNFHYEDCGHTTIVGPAGSGKTVLLNFMLSQARKFHTRLFFFDQQHAATVFIRALGGEYFTLTPKERTENQHYNPLSLADTPANRLFLQRWFSYLLMISPSPTEVDIDSTTAHLVKTAYELPDGQRTLSQLATRIDADLAAQLSPWYGQGEYAALFDNADDSFSTTNPMQAFDVSAIVQDQASLGPVLSYLFYRIELLLDGTPTIIVLDEAWKLINNPVFAPRLGEWLDTLRDRNAMVIFATETSEDLGKRKITHTITERIATKIFLPVYRADASYQNVWGLSEEETSALQSLDSSRRQFLLKHGDVAVAAALDLDNINHIVSILSGGEETIAQMNECIAEVGSSDPAAWLPLFYEKAWHGKKPY